MRVSVVAALLLGALVCATADVSFPKPGTGRLTCILPIKQLRCIVDTRTGFVAGIRYGYGPYGEVNVCSQGNSFQTSWDMSPVSYQQGITCDDGSTYQNATGQPSWSNRMVIEEPYLMPYGSMISQVLVLKGDNPLGPEFGDIAAIAFRYTNQDLAESADPAAGCRTDAYDWAVCGNLDYARAYLEPGSAPAPGPVSLKSVYTSPLSEDGFPSFLGSFQGKCFVRGSGYLGGDPHTSSKFHLLGLKKVCFSKLAHVVPTKPKNPLPHRPHIDYDWNVPYTPCYWDKKDSKDSASISCALSGAAVATGKYGVIYVGQDGAAYDWQYGEDGHYSKVEASSIFMGEEPEEAVESADK